MTLCVANLVAPVRVRHMLCPPDEGLGETLRGKSHASCCTCARKARAKLVTAKCRLTLDVNHMVAMGATNMRYGYGKNDGYSKLTGADSAAG